MTSPLSRRKRHRILGVLAAVLFLGLTPAMSAESKKSAPKSQSNGNANAVASLKKILTACETSGHDAACEKQLWEYADVTKDGVITSAEISRFLRLTSTAENWLQSASDPGQDFILWTLVGPIAGNLILANFDFDGDGKISQRELYLNLGEGQAQHVLGDIAAAGKTLISMAMMTAATTNLPGILGSTGMTMGQASPKKPQTKESTADKPKLKMSVQQPSATLTPAPAPKMARTNHPKPSNRTKTFSANDRKSLVTQIARCWRLPQGLTLDEVQDFSAPLQLSIRRNGKPSAVTFSGDEDRLKQDVSYRAFTDSALKAALDPLCHPFGLPRENYTAWRRLTIAFKPNIARFD
jgi:hypothetical protein